jgi:hypothetical protein
LILVAFINASIDFYQIQKSEAILASFLAMIPPACRVVRDGTISTIPAADLVKGDIVLLVSSVLFYIFIALIYNFCKISVVETKLPQISSCSLPPI